MPSKTKKRAEIPDGLPLVRRLEGHSGLIHSVLVTPNGRLIVSGSADKTIRVWQLDSGRLLHTLEGHTASITSLAVTPDGRSIVSGSLDKTIRVWDINSGILERILKGHTGAVYS